MKLYAYAIGALACFGLAIGAYFYGRHDGTEIEKAKHLEAEAFARDARDAMIQAAAEAIGKIEVRHQTIRQEVQREIIEKPVFRECRNTPDSLRLLNDALQDKQPESPVGGVLPESDAPN